MALTRLDMSHEVLDNMAREGGATTRNGVTLSDMSVRWLNRAQLEASRKYPMLYRVTAISTVVDQESYDLPAGLRRLHSMVVEDGHSSSKVTCIMPWNFDAVVPKPDEDSTQRPTHYIPKRVSGTFSLYRIPDAIYTLRLSNSYWPSAFATAASTSSFQDVGIDADDATIALATGYGYSYLQELADAQKWRNLGWNLWKDVYASHIDSFPDWAPRQIGYSPRDTNSLPGDYYNNPFVLRM